MGILSAIVQLLGGLALFLYGIELMGDGLKNSSGAALKRVLEKVTGNVVMGVLTGALVTAVIQSSTATIVLTVALIGAGVLNLKQAVSIVMGANIGTTVTAQIIRLGSIQSDGSWLLWLFDTDTLAPIALIIGIVLLMFIKSKRSNTIGDICIGFGVLFVGLELMTDGVKPLIGTSAFTSFVGFLENPLFGILFGLILTVIGAIIRVLGSEHFSVAERGDLGVLVLLLLFTFMTNPVTAQRLGRVARREGLYGTPEHMSRNDAPAERSLRTKGGKASKSGKAAKTAKTGKIARPDRGGQA